MYNIPCPFRLHFFPAVQISQDPTSRQSFTTAAFLPLFSFHYVLAVLAFILIYALLPILLWQPWKCAVGLDFSAGLPNLFGLESSARLSHFNVTVCLSYNFVVEHTLLPIPSTDDRAGWGVRYGADVCHLLGNPLRRYNPPPPSSAPCPF